MTTRTTLLAAICLASLSGCVRVGYIPAVDVPVVETQAPVPRYDAQPSAAASDVRPGWRPYSSGPLQASSPGLRLRATSRPSAVRRAPLAAPPAAPPQAAWKAPAPAAVSVFGQGVSSEWAQGYVPESLRDEFAIFTRKAATDEQARMVSPTGEVYAALVTRRNGSCSTVEVTVTEGGDLPILARGLVEVCRAR